MAHRLMVLPGDSEDLRALNAQLGSEFEIQVIDNANDALWEVRSNPPDVIVANIDLDGLTGLDIAEILPNFGLPTKLVLWTSKPDPQVATQALELGVFRTLVAPVALDEMRSAIHEAQQAAAVAAEVEEEEEEAEPEVEPAPAPERERSRRLHDVPAPPPPTERSRRMHDVAPAPTPAERDRSPRRHDVAPAPAPTPTERDRARRHDVAPAPPPPEQNRSPRRHDVAPAPAPPEQNRTNRKPHDVSPAPSLAERARRAAQQQDSQSPIPAAGSDTGKPAHTRQGALILTADNLKPIRARMEALEREFGSQCIMLADRAGMLLAECGVTTGIPTMVLLPLLSTSFSTAGQISQMLRERESSALYMHEGANYDVYCFDVLQRYMLVVVFSKSAGSQVAKIGSVWVYAKRAIRDIEELLS